MKGRDGMEEEGLFTDDPAEHLIKDIGNSELHHRKRIPVGVLGATGTVGQRFVELLAHHPWFDLVAVAGSEKSEGKTYKEAVYWQLPVPIPSYVAKMTVVGCTPTMPCKLVFSALDSSIAGDVEEEFAQAGYVVVSNAKNHRMDPAVPLLIPEVNIDHLSLVKEQKFPNKGMIVTNPNCAVIGLAIALKPLILEFGVEKVHVVTLQSSSGAGFPGVPSLSLLDNIIPFIADEAEKIETEPQKIFGTLEKQHILPSPLKISAQCTRVPITEGHIEVVSVKFNDAASHKEVERAWKEFLPPVQEMKLPSSCVQPIHYFEEEHFPQPKLHRNLEDGMAVSIGRLQKCSIFDYKFVLLSNNMVRGAAGGAIQIGELLVKQGHVYW